MLSEFLKKLLNGYKTLAGLIIAAIGGAILTFFPEYSEIAMEIIQWGLGLAGFGTAHKVVKWIRAKIKKS
jgi:hypothetical protein